MRPLRMQQQQEEEGEEKEDRDAFSLAVCRYEKKEDAFSVLVLLQGKLNTRTNLDKKNIFNVRVVVKNN